MVRWSTLLFAACAFSGGSVNPTTDSNVDSPLVDAPVADSTMADADLSICEGVGLVCEGATRAITCNNRCWVSCSTKVAHPVAEARCVAWSGLLAPLQTAEDFACVDQMLFVDQASWTGLEQATGSADKHTGWSWNGDGIDTPYRNWGSGQPNDFDGTEDDAEQCAYISGPSGNWHDTTCATNITFQFSCRR